MGYGMKLLITDNCNVSCAHCKYSCGPGGSSISDEHIDLFVNKLINEPFFNLTISGGEVFTVKPKLYAVLRAVNRKVFGDCPGFIEIATNGFWAQDLTVAGRTLDELISEAELRPDLRPFITYTGYTKFHKAQGLKIDDIKSNLARACHDKGFKFGVYETNSLYPFGRAKGLSESKHEFNDECKIIGGYHMGFHVNYDGLIYLCDNLGFSVGSLLDKNLLSLSHLHSMLERSPVARYLINPATTRSDLVKAGKAFGSYKPEFERIKNICSLCEALFSGASLSDFSIV